ncbi:MAG TPA: RDD family protein [Chloroflexota bacterium]|jgi:uncharacterized RDD family membrane protein YckC
MKERDVGDAYRIGTPEQIDLAYDVAGLGSRFLAALVDTVIQTGLLVLIWFGSISLVALLDGVGGRADDTGLASAMQAAAALGTFATLWGYHVFCEMVWHGQTPGKRWVGLRVIKEGGYPIGFVDSVIRNVVRLVDFLPLFYVIGAIVMFVDRRSRRLGDLAAGTLVVKERRELRLEGVTAGLFAPADGASPLAPELARLSPADRSLLREYLRRRGTLTVAAREALAAKVAPGMAGKIGREIGQAGPDGFLVRLADELGGRPAVAAPTASAPPASDGRPRRSLPAAILTPLGVILLGALAVVVALAFLFWPSERGGATLAPTPTSVVGEGTPRPRPTALRRRRARRADGVLPGVLQDDDAGRPR